MIEVRLFTVASPKGLMHGTSLCLFAAVKGRAKHVKILGVVLAWAPRIEKATRNSQAVKTQFIDNQEMPNWCYKELLCLYSHRQPACPIDDKLYCPATRNCSKPAIGSQKGVDMLVAVRLSTGSQAHLLYDYYSSQIARLVGGKFSLLQNSNHIQRKTTAISRRLHYQKDASYLGYHKDASWSLPRFTWLSQRVTHVASSLCWMQTWRSAYICCREIFVHRESAVHCWLS